MALRSLPSGLLTSVASEQMGGDGGVGCSWTIVNGTGDIDVVGGRVDVVACRAGGAKRAPRHTEKKNGTSINAALKTNSMIALY